MKASLEILAFIIISSFTATFSKRMAYMLATLFALLCLPLSQASKSTPLTHQILLVLPLQDIRGPTAGWERGHEILPGAQIVTEMINSNSTIGYQLQLIPIDGGRCESSVSQFKFLPQLINSTFNQGLNAKVAIGFLCHNEFQVMLDSPSSISYIITKVLKMQPMTLVDTLLSFMQYMEWTRIGIVTELKDFFFFNSAEAIAKAIEKNSNLTLSKMIQIPTNVYKIDYDLPKVLFLSMSPSLLVKVLCSAYRRDLLWPDHVWILHSYRLMDFITDTSFSCNISRALEGAIVINEQLTPVDNVERYSNFYNSYVKKLLDHSKQHNITLQPNMYAYVAYDLVWEIALTLSIRQQRINRTVPHQQQRNMNIIQIKGQNKVIENLIATYSPHSGELRINSKLFKSTAPSDELPLVVSGVPLAYTIIFSILTMMVFIVETSTLTVFIYFRKEPEIKSTSFSLSLLMFFGCYVCNIYTPVSLYFQQPLIGTPDTEHTLCNVRLWLSNIGIYFIEVTLLVKILRVYHIFFRYKAKPIGKNCSDTFLACYVLIMLSPTIILHVLWSFLDSYGSILVKSPKQSYIELEKRCGPNKPVWYILLSVYGYSISTALVTVAIKTRKIRHKHFKDSRKVNMYLFCFTAVIAMTFGYWLFLERSNTYEYYLSITPVHIGLSMIVLLCQFLLFVPKVLPPFKRYIMARCCNRTVYNKYKGTNQTVTTTRVQ